jgi:hypothetical protein
MMSDATSTNSELSAQLVLTFWRLTRGNKWLPCGHSRGAYSERQRHEVIRLKVEPCLRRMWLTFVINFRLVLLSPLEQFSGHELNEWQLRKNAGEGERHDVAVPKRIS